jgi:hypothetical protein
VLSQSKNNLRGLWISSSGFTRGWIFLLLIAPAVLGEGAGFALALASAGLVTAVDGAGFSRPPSLSQRQRPVRSKAETENLRAEGSMGGESGCWSRSLIRCVLKMGIRYIFMLVGLPSRFALAATTFWLA